jgi:RNA polymerase sigma factor (sigma-70 family)
MASRFRNYGLPMGDLVQEGNVGLMQAAARFEPERDVRFSTYASWWIRSAMQDYVLRNWSIVRTGTTAAQKSLFFNLRRLRAKISDASATQMTPAQRLKIAKELNVNVGDVEQMEGRMSAGDQSLNAHVGKHNAFVASLEGRVLPQARKMTELSIGDSYGEVPELEPVEHEVREPLQDRDLLIDGPKD